MAKRDPAERLKSLLARLKRQKLRDGRVSRTDAEVQSEDEGWLSGSGTNWLICEWQVWMSLGFYARSAATAVPDDDWFDLTPLAAPFVVDERTILHVGQRELEVQGWTYLLVWRVGEDFGFRTLSGAEVDQVSDLHHEMLCGLLGIRLDRLPPDGLEAGGG